MPKRKTRPSQPAATAEVRIRRGYFESRFGQLHVHHAIPGGGGFEERTPLLALHAATHSGQMFAAVLRVLGGDRSAFAPDLPGFGQSDAPEGVSIAEQAAAINDFLDAMRLRQIDVFGCGLGMEVALELAAIRPGVRRVIVSVPATTNMPQPPRSSDDVEAYLRSVWAGARSDCGADTPLEQVLAACGERLRNAMQIAHAAVAERDYPLRERLGRISQPLLVLHPPEWSHGDLPSHARRVPCGELGRLQVAPQAVVAAIHDFLAVA